MIEIIKRWLAIIFLVWLAFDLFFNGILILIDSNIARILFFLAIVPVAFGIRYVKNNWW